MDPAVRSLRSMLPPKGPGGHELWTPRTLGLVGDESTNTPVAGATPIVPMNGASGTLFVSVTATHRAPDLGDSIEVLPDVRDGACRRDCRQPDVARPESGYAVPSTPPIGPVLLMLYGTRGLMSRIWIPSGPRARRRRCRPGRRGCAVRISASFLPRWGLSSRRPPGPAGPPWAGTPNCAKNVGRGLTSPSRRIATWCRCAPFPRTASSGPVSVDWSAALDHVLGSRGHEVIRTSPVAFVHPLPIVRVRLSGPDRRRGATVADSRRELIVPCTRQECEASGDHTAPTRSVNTRPCCFKCLWNSLVGIWPPFLGVDGPTASLTGGILSGEESSATLGSSWRHVKAVKEAVSTRNRNVPVLSEIEMSPGDGLWTLCETRLRVLQGAVGASARPRRRQRP